jgi:hypothetical protein
VREKWSLEMCSICSWNISNFFWILLSSWCVNPRRLSDTPKTKPWWKMLDLKGDGMLGIQWVAGQIPHPKSTPTKPPCFFESHKNPEGFFGTSSTERPQLFPSFHHLSIEAAFREITPVSFSDDEVKESFLFASQNLQQNGCNWFFLMTGWWFQKYSNIVHVPSYIMVCVDLCTTSCCPMVMPPPFATRIWLAESLGQRRCGLWRGHFFRFASGCGAVKASVHLHDFCEARLFRESERCE